MHKLIDLEFSSSIEMIDIVGILFNSLLDLSLQGVCFLCGFEVRFLNVMQSATEQYKKTYIDRHIDVHGSLTLCSLRPRDRGKTILLERIFQNIIWHH